EDQTGNPSQGFSVTGEGSGYGAGAGYGTAGTGQFAGQTYGLPLLGRLFFGSGGGGALYPANCSSGVNGGAGGGAVLLFANSLSLAADTGAATGRIHADAQAGCSNSGGGAGGSIWLSAPS